MLILVTGGAGFIGSNLVDALLTQGHSVRVVDNLSTGCLEFIEKASSNEAFQFVEADLLDKHVAREASNGVDAVVHLAANADVRFGWDHPFRDIEQNLISTHNLLEGMRRNKVRRFIFSSTGSVYGKSGVFPTPENAPFPIQTSLYGASKIAAEALTTAYSEAGFLSATIFRFVSILGPRYTHGHVLDFVSQLLKHPDQLVVLGNGAQKKSYLHVSDCVSAILKVLFQTDALQILNLGHNDFCTVRESASWIADFLQITPSVEFGTSNQGWVGDNPFIFLDNKAMKMLDWNPTFSIKQSVQDTVAWLINNPWVLSRAAQS